MRIIYFRLKGYVRILNGTGLDEISIDFSNFKNRIILIQGENGCGKSTIISAMTPNPDGSDSFRTDVFIDEYGNRQIIEYPAEKEIHYIGKDEFGKDTIYSILIQSIVDESRTKRTTKAFISKNGEELNPNGNVSSFKEIRDNLLGIDSVYLDLSSISSENRGIVDMIPSERRKYMAAYIGSFETYNNIYKVISKKVTSLKAYLGTINAKLYELGNEDELRIKVSQATSTLNSLTTRRDELLKQLASAEATVSLIDPDNKMQDLYASISDRLRTVKSEMSKKDHEYVKLYTDLKIEPQIDIRKLLEDSKDTLKSYNTSLSDNKSKMSTLVSLNESVVEVIESDKSILMGMNSDIAKSNIESTIEKIRSDILMYESHLDNSFIISGISLDDLYDLRESLNQFTNEISIAEDMYSDKEFQDAVFMLSDSERKKVMSLSESLRQEVVDNKIEQSNLIKDLESFENDRSILNDFNKVRPKNCQDTCPFIEKYIALRDKMSRNGSIESITSRIDHLASEIKSKNDQIESISHSIEIAGKLELAIATLFSKKSIISRFEKISKILDQNYLKNALISHYRFPEFKLVTTFIENYTIYNDLKEAKEQLKSLESDLESYNRDKKLIDEISKRIEDNKNLYKSREEEIKRINKDCMFISNMIDTFTAKVNNLQRLIEISSDLESLNKDIDSLRNEFEVVKDKIKLVKEKIDSVNDIKNELARVDEAIAPQQSMINQMNYDLTSILKYQEEYKENSDIYEKMVFIRNACSPGGGLSITNEYVKRYMNDIIIDCNKMLGYMFNGAIQLDVPVINEKQFSIPFIGPNGIPVPDISNGSTAQKCMISLIFSCVAMMKSSTRYNIPRFDEIDGGLDQYNRIMFINVLNQILDVMDCEQCIICSHNMEFDTTSTTRIICSHSGINIEQ